MTWYKGQMQRVTSTLAISMGLYYFWSYHAKDEANYCFYDEHKWMDDIRQ